MSLPLDVNAAGEFFANVPAESGIAVPR